MFEPLKFYWICNTFVQRGGESNWCSEWLETVCRTSDIKNKIVSDLTKKILVVTLKEITSQTD